MASVLVTSKLQKKIMGKTEQIWAEKKIKLTLPFLNLLFIVTKSNIEFGYFRWLVWTAKWEEEGSKIDKTSHQIPISQEIQRERYPRTPKTTEFPKSPHQVWWRKEPMDVVAESTLRLHIKELWRRVISSSSSRIPTQSLSKPRQSIYLTSYYFLPSNDQINFRNSMCTSFCEVVYFSSLFSQLLFAFLVTTFDRSPPNKRRSIQISL